MIHAIYDNRTFFVVDGGVSSKRHAQRNGISQGCPLSPFLFIIVITVLLHDVKQEMGPSTESLLLSDLVYADDTLLVGTSDIFLQRFMTCIGRAGGSYGLSVNWNKLEAMPVRTIAQLKKPDGNDIVTKEAILYLGSLLSADGRNGSEINRRIGMAKADFETLMRVWRHTSISRKRKLRIFDACIISILSYGLMPMCLNAMEKKRKLERFT